ncbi:MAG: DUF4202 family protein [Bacteroidetes bacterium]|nr:DUF4202 family protein [Bacteroidota bacterium]
MNNIEFARQKILQIVATSNLPEDLPHAKNILKWLLRLKPEADESLRLAALAHDIDRADEHTKVKRSDFKDYSSFKAAHAKHSAEILQLILEECKVEKSVVEESCRLVLLHEVGGDDRSNLLMYADSISFFDVNLPHYFRREGWEETLRRAIWGLKRIPNELWSLIDNISFNNKDLTKIINVAKKKVVDSAFR